MGSRVETNALTTLESAKRYIGIKPHVHDDDAFLLDVINAASAWTKRYLGGTPIKQESFAFDVANEGLLSGNGTNYLKLPYRPIIEVTSLVPDTRYPGTAWTWNGSAETGSMTYGVTKDWSLNMRTGEIWLHGHTFADGPYVSIVGRAGFADGTYTADSGFPFGGDIFTSGNDGGRYHRLFGWDTAGRSLRNAVDELVAYVYRYKDRVKDNVASRSGEGINITFFDNIPKEVTQALANALPPDPVS